MLALLGGAIQAGAVNTAMLIVGRLVAGMALGVLTMIVSRNGLHFLDNLGMVPDPIYLKIPMYNAEVAHPNLRGLMAGMLQQMLCL